jgi:hypothetical protein
MTSRVRCSRLAESVTLQVSFTTAYPTVRSLVRHVKWVSPSRSPDCSRLFERGRAVETGRGRAEVTDGVALHRLAEGIEG